MEVMKAQGLRRLVVESAFGAGESLAVASLMERLVFATLLWAPYQDKNLLEPAVKESGLEWTILRPTMLMNGQRTGRYVVTTGRPAVGRVARADVAMAMLRAVERAVDWRVSDGDGRVRRVSFRSEFQRSSDPAANAYYASVCINMHRGMDFQSAGLHLA